MQDMDLFTQNQWATLRTEKFDPNLKPLLETKGLSYRDKITMQ